MTQQPTEPLVSDGYDLPYQLPRNLEEGLTLMAACEPLGEILGHKFLKAYFALKETEYEAFFRVISSWERRHLLLRLSVHSTGTESRRKHDVPQRICWIQPAAPSATAAARATQARTTAEYRALDAAHHIHPFSDMGALNRAGSRVIVKADGVYLWDSDGNKVIDGMAGLWCVNVGYGRRNSPTPRIARSRNCRSTTRSSRPRTRR